MEALMEITSGERRTTVESADGTRIGVTYTGEGPSLVLVEPAGHHRGFSACDGLVSLLRSEFTVVTYDRRGRGESTDTAPYSVVREVEDLAAVIEQAGGKADVHGASSGALLAIQAAVHGVPIRRRPSTTTPRPRWRSRRACVSTWSATATRPAWRSSSGRSCRRVSSTR
jgi:hypothetical protein